MGGPGETSTVPIIGEFTVIQVVILFSSTYTVSETVTLCPEKILPNSLANRTRPISVGKHPNFVDVYVCQMTPSWQETWKNKSFPTTLNMARNPERFQTSAKTLHKEHIQEKNLKERKGKRKGYENAQSGVNYDQTQRSCVN